MDWLTFISNMTTALAWPSVIAFGAYHFRSEIRDMAGAIKRLKIFSAEAEWFDREVKAVRSSAELLPRTDEPGPLKLPDHTGDHGGPPAPQLPTLAATPATGPEHTLLPPFPPPYTPTQPGRSLRGFAFDPPGSALSDAEKSMAALKAVERFGPKRGVIFNGWSALESALRSIARMRGVSSELLPEELLVALGPRTNVLTPEEFEVLDRLYNLRGESARSTQDPSDQMVRDFAATTTVLLDRLERLRASIKSG